MATQQGYSLRINRSAASLSYNSVLLCLVHTYVLEYVHTYVREPPLPALAMSWPCDPLHAPSARAVFSLLLDYPTSICCLGFRAGDLVFMRPSKPYPFFPPPLFFDISCFDVAVVCLVPPSVYYTRLAPLGGLLAVVAVQD